MTIILAINAGSSSLRLALYRAEGTLQQVVAATQRAPERPDPAALQTFIRQHHVDRIDCVVHRVVHGGPDLDRPMRIDAAVEAEIERLVPLAPLHNPVALGWIRAARRVLPAGTLEVAAFDTAFYADLPAAAATYALPLELSERHRIRRYGFHGLAHQAMLDRWLEDGGDRSARVISLQLGSGCSVTASLAGRPVDTSMGFSPLEGLMMATRTGDLDPAVVIHLLQHDTFTPERLLELLNTQSGLLGVSGLSRDMKVLLDDDAPRARLAVDMFCGRVRKYIGAYLAVLGGVDAVLVGGGIGERSAEIRRRILGGFGWAGIVLSAQRNRTLQAGGGPIQQEGSAVALSVIEVDEMYLMARAALDLATRNVTEGED